ncbi:ketopantoate reductase family protein [Colwellia sp. MEBiC06753]
MSSATENLKVVIVGLGAIGSLWYYYLHRSNHISVSYLPRDILSKKYDSTQQTPIQNFSQFNGFSEQIHINQASKQMLLNADLVIVCVKSQYCADRVNQLAPLLNDKTEIILCHNGMGVYQAINKQLKSRLQFYTLLTTHGCFKPTPFHTIHTGLGQCDLGRVNHLPNKAESRYSLTCAPAWLASLNQALPPINWQQNIKEKQWQKLAVNCVINPLTAIYDIKNGEIQSPAYSEVIHQIASEVAQAAHTEGVEMAAQAIITNALNVAKATQLNTSSMLADVLAKRPTEISSINGFICQLAQKNGFNAPANEQMVTSINAIERKSLESSIAES